MMPILFETERLIARNWSLDDAPRLFEICSDERVMLHIGSGKAYTKIEEAEKFINWAILYYKANGFSRWAFLEKTSNIIIGSCGFAKLSNGEIEFGYLFARQFWGKGYATEAGKGCIKYGFETLKLRQIIGLTDVNHVASQNVLTKIGFIFRGIEPDGMQGEDAVYEIFNQA